MVVNKIDYHTSRFQLKIKISEQYRIKMLSHLHVLRVVAISLVGIVFGRKENIINIYYELLLYL